MRTVSSISGKSFFRAGPKPKEIYKELDGYITDLISGDDINNTEPDLP